MDVSFSFPRSPNEWLNNFFLAAFTSLNKGFYPYLLTVEQNLLFTEAKAFLEFSEGFCFQQLGEEKTPKTLSPALSYLFLLLCRDHTQVLMEEDCAERIALEGEGWRKGWQNLQWGLAVAGLGEQEVCFFLLQPRPPQSQMSGSTPTEQVCLLTTFKRWCVYFFFSSEAAVWLGEEVSGTGSFWRSFLLLG